MSLWSSSSRARVAAAVMKLADIVFYGDASFDVRYGTLLSVTIAPAAPSRTYRIPPFLRHRVGGAEAGGQVRSGFSARGWQHRGVGYTVRHASHDHIHPSALLQVDSVPSRVLLTRLLILLCVRDAVLDLAGERGAAQGRGQKFETLKNVEQGGAYSLQ